MKKLLTIMVILLFAATVWAAPFLVCTPDPAATSYLIKVNGTAAIELPAPLHWDLAPLNDGQYNLEVAAKNIWGQSIYVPFDFNKAVPGTPQGIGLSQE